jgi:formylmethanofuran dehydrogenase subunit E
LKDILKDFGDINYISIVAFTTRAELKVTSKTDVVYTINLPKTIKKYKYENITDLVKDDVYLKLISLNIDSKETRKTHVKAIHRTLDEKRIKVNSDICPKCGGNLILRYGKFGKFKGCSNFPKCRFIVN